MAIKVEMLKCFVTVAHHGSLSDAANALGRTSSAVSMMLKQFEDHIGAPLFETGRKSRLTSLGQMIFQEAQRGIRQFENTVSVIENLSRAEMGYLRLAVTPTVATTILPPVVHAFTSTHPQVQIDIRDMDSAAIANELRRERIDIGIGSLPEIEGMSHLELFTDAFGVVCRRDDPLSQTWDTFTWRNMPDVTLIANGLCDSITDPDFVAILAQSRLRVPNTTSLLSLVREGVGITVLPRMALSDHHEDLTFLPLADLSARRRVNVVSAPDHLLMPAARAFLDTISETLNDGTLEASEKFQNF